MVCSICQRPCKSLQSLRAHLWKSHSVKHKDYLIKYFYDGKHPVCACGCNKEVNYFRGTFKRYLQGHFIRVDNSFLKTEEASQKRKRTNIEKYGGSTPAASVRVKEKIRKTCFKKYGTSTPLKNKEIKEKIKLTMIKNYGTTIPLRSPEIMEKVKQTNMKKYGVEFIGASASVKKKKEKSCLQKHGVKFSLQSQEVRKKIKRTNIDKYGVEFPLKISEKTIEECCKKKGYIPLFDYEEYKGYRHFYDFKCKKHKKTFQSSIFNIQKKSHQCPSCKIIGVSSSEKEIVKYLKSFYSGLIVENTRKIIAPQELDIFIPDKKLGIEFNGLYWHSSAGPNWRRGSHMKKAKLCQKSGINFFSFFEDEWKNKQHLVKQMIRCRLGLVDQKITAKKCKIIKLEQGEELQSFFNRNHLDGNAECKYAYCLTYKDKIVAAISMRINQKATEIVRFATDCDYVIFGAATKLISLLPRPVVGFSNNRLSSGEIFKKNGFKEISETTDAGGWYTDLKSRGSKNFFVDNKPLFFIEDAGYKKFLLE